MASDVKEIIRNLTSFYDFTDKVICSVGAGGQLIEYCRNAKMVYAVDNDRSAIQRLEDSLSKAGLASKFEVILSDFYDVRVVCDVVLFEFCLHEMVNPGKAIIHAKTLGADIVIFDHWTESEWAFYVDEKEKVFASWKAINTFTFKKKEVYNTVQFFNDYEELFQKVKVMGDVSISRIASFKEQKNFTIPMSYGIVQL
ncbi:MAG: hypothetical protein EHM93_18060 [Bacteroidales bacterium]|nr:MAG: hypothetical protein EHM93_18060 [Bacteroidales bacterium]